jgi:hypothetical protein
MGSNRLTNNPFAILTFIAAPAILTSATSELAMSTANRMLRTRDWMHELLKESADPGHRPGNSIRRKSQPGRTAGRVVAERVALDLCGTGRVCGSQSGDVARGVVRGIGT